MKLEPHLIPYTKISFQQISGKSKSINRLGRNIYEHLIDRKTVITAVIRMAAVSVTECCVTNHSRTSQLLLTVHLSGVGNPGWLAAGSVSRAHC